MARKQSSSRESTRSASPAIVAASGDEDDGKKKSLLPVVGIGASAGGIEAISQLLRALPPDTGMAFVVVVHLDPTHSSSLAQIFSRATAMRVSEAQDQAPVEANHVYVIPPGARMAISEGTLRLTPREYEPGPLRVVDLFLRSLAADRGQAAIGVILSGTATDGTLGLEAIKAEGGITFAQDSTAQQGGMPGNAIAAGCVDLVLPPEEIAREIHRISRLPYVASPSHAQALQSIDSSLSRIVQLIREGTGVDFSQYKHTTLHRRIVRRMVLHKVESHDEYLQLLERNPAEVEALYQDILISVTSFFRNPETFEVLKAEVFPNLTRNRSRHEAIRMWVLGCSTGEEAYSMAIAYVEYASSAGLPIPGQIFATDVNEIRIEKARSGMYSKQALENLSAERIERFFVPSNGGYRVDKGIRDMCVFARHNALSDPPFSRVDLISCRNLLIYLEPSMQQRLIPILSYALNPGGALILGTSETIGSHRELFDLVDAKHKIYFKKPDGRRVPEEGQRRPPARDSLLEARRIRELALPSGLDYQREADRLLLSRYAPPGVLVDARLDVLQFRGDTGPYLSPAPGKASLNLLKMLREGLLVAVRSALHRAEREESSVRETGIRIKSDDVFRTIDLRVIPVRRGSEREGCFLILFEETVPKAEPPRLPPGPPAAASGAAETESTQERNRLEQELAATREYLQSVIEQQQEANEDLQSANEEVESTNEELQSINEELETSKEEIQSTNEELATVNDELQIRNRELGQLNTDLLNIMSSIQMALMILGKDHRIRWFTPTSEQILNLISSDVGRPISDIKLNIEVPNLEDLLSQTLQTAKAREMEVRDRKGAWYLLRLTPYLSAKNKVEGAVVALFDINALKQSYEYSQAIVTAAAQPLLVLDAEMRVRTASPSYYEMFCVSPQEAENRTFYEIGASRWDKEALTGFLELNRRRDFSTDGIEVPCAFGSRGRRTLLVSTRRIEQSGSTEPLILLSILDITERKQLEEDLCRRVEELAAADRSKNEFLAMLAHELRNPLAPIRNALQIFMTSTADSQALERAKSIMTRQIENLARMVDDLLDVSRITQGKVHLQKEPSNLGAILTQTAELIRNETSVRNQELTLSLPREPIWLDADPTRLEQVFGNVLANASRFTPLGGHIWVTAERVSRDSREVRPLARISIRDDGIGIAPELLPHIFELFMQADRSLARTQGGLGIGLTLVKRVVEMHNGTVEARSRGSGEGTEVVIQLPCLGGRTPASRSERPPREVALPNSPRRILIVDDNVDSAQSLGMIFELAGHWVQVTHDGLAALELAPTFQPEVVVLDVGLPEMDGYELVRRLRQMPGLEKSTFVAVTGYAQEDDRRRAKEAGFDIHLSKPVDPAILEDLLLRSTAAES